MRATRSTSHTDHAKPMKHWGLVEMVPARVGVFWLPVLVSFQLVSEAFRNQRRLGTNIYLADASPVFPC